MNGKDNAESSVVSSQCTFHKGEGLQGVLSDNGLAFQQREEKECFVCR